MDDKIMDFVGEHRIDVILEAVEKWIEIEFDELPDAEAGDWMEAKQRMRDLAGAVRVIRQVYEEHSFNARKQQPNL